MIWSASSTVLGVITIYKLASYCNYISFLLKRLGKVLLFILGHLIPVSYKIFALNTVNKLNSYV